MITFLKYVGRYTHSRLRNKKFKEFQVLYEKAKKSIQDFIPIGSPEDERLIEKINKKAAGEIPQRRRMFLKNLIVLKWKLSKKKLRRVPGRDHIVPDEEGIVDYKVLEKRFLIIYWESKFYHYDRHGAEGIYYRIFRSDRSSRWIKTFSEMVTRFDRLDLVELYNLVMQRFETTTPEGVDLVLWGDLRTMFNANAEDELWQN
ncbi:hypothetical protein Tco_1147224 [Tanacetum coccineum]